jgi:hypothetical protein
LEWLSNGASQQQILADYPRLEPEDFFAVYMDRGFQDLLRHVPDARVVILRSRDYLTDVAAAVLRRNAIRVGELLNSQDLLIFLDQ